ncbi:type IV secretion system protein [Veillonella magna]|uniref:Type IV secretion system protein n=1 Tax=Veillonella magna TaxID=464322 RepID=A0ABS2GEW3_9FIRM|nr:type IV secretion system protein [Veillonella magna]MBM6823561.1 type IV secretion system protein [Veillonella magna]MBM6911905.1 type IV secretion system protein [Veillonella magna]
MPVFKGDFSGLGALQALTNFFRDGSVAGYHNLLPYAYELFFALATIDLAITWTLYKGEFKMQAFVERFTKIGFTLLLMQMLPEINAFILNSFKQAGLIAGGNHFTIKSFTDPTQILQTGVKIIGFETSVDSGTASSAAAQIPPENTLLGKMAKISIFESGGLSNVVMCFFAMLLILAGFFMMSIELMMAIIEFNIFASIMIILIPFSALKFTSFIFQRCVSAVFQFAIKLLLIYFLLSLVWATTEKFTNVAPDSFGTMLTQGLVYLTLGYLVMKIPELVSGMMSGSPAMSGNGVANTIAGGAAGFAAGVASGAVKSYGGARAVIAASRVQGVNRWDSFKGTVSNIPKNTGALLRGVGPVTSRKLIGADKANEYMRAGNAIRSGEYAKQTDEQRNAGLATAISGRPLTEKAQAQSNKSLAAAQKSLDSLNNLTPPKSSNYSSSSSSKPYDPNNF